MLESELDTCVLAKCLSDPENAPNIVKKSKEYILHSDFRNLLASTSNSLTSAAPAAHIATHTSWRLLWDIALDKGVKGTRVMQNIFKELCRPRSCFRCTICDTNVPKISRVYNMHVMPTRMKWRTPHTINYCLYSLQLTRWTLFYLL